MCGLPFAYSGLSHLHLQHCSLPRDLQRGGRGVLLQVPCFIGGMPSLDSLLNQMLETKPDAGKKANSNIVSLTDGVDALLKRGRLAQAPRPEPLVTIAANDPITCALYIK